MSDTEFIDISKLEGFIAYLSNIEWRDPWLIGLFTFHLSICMMAILTRNYGNFQALLFFFLLLLVYFSENINNLASTNWKIFSRQQYFDSNGLFISIVFSMPILINCMLMVGNWLYQSTQLMTTLKTAQLKEKLRKEKSREKLIKQNAKTE
ncbi:transmembrane protein 18 [Dendroctonus ponderosae]|uniref:transmembrane protein 18 n=1 Tax=Dendroctonus ponderosae TaxID=77166 RepID=UPI002034A8CD|nr:transmembrane protein 18 [Dendroctonus ponderosae]